jgi:hypothetical protein
MPKLQHVNPAACGGNQPVFTQGSIWRLEVGAFSAHWERPVPADRERAVFDTSGTKPWHIGNERGGTSGTESRHIGNASKMRLASFSGATRSRHDA